MKERFEKIYHEHVGAVFRFTLHCVGRKEIAEEITSEAFLALLRNLESIHEAQLPGWLITVARNRARDYWRRQETERKYLEAIKDPPVVGSDHNRDWLIAEPGLKPIHRVCLTLRYVEGLTRTEIAEALGISEVQVKGHLQYGLQLMRKTVSGAMQK